MQLQIWISVQRQVLAADADGVAKKVQTVVAKYKDKNPLTVNGRSTRFSDLRVRVRLVEDRYLSIEWLVRRWYTKDGMHRFRTTYIRKGRGLAYRDAALSRYARTDDREAVLEAEQKFAEIRRKAKQLSEFESLAKEVGCLLTVTVGPQQDEKKFYPTETGLPDWSDLFKGY
ncbi:MAG: conjugative transfer protein MobI(A/C) [Acidiferrobacter sp.]